MNTFHSTEKRYACSFPSCGKGNMIVFIYILMAKLAQSIVNCIFDVFFFAAFKRKRHLDDHEGVHLEERPYMCDKCGMCMQLISLLNFVS